MKQLARLLVTRFIDEGVDIMFVAAGASGNGVITAAEGSRRRIYHRL